MWCSRKNCVNKSDYVSAMQKKRYNKDTSSGGNPSSNGNPKPAYSKDFKIALAALTSAEYFASLEDQFFQPKE